MLSKRPDAPSFQSTLRSRDWLLAYGLPGLLLILGIAVRLIQYSFNRSLWSDEVKLVLNILNRSYSEFLEPLNHNQAAPVGFLMVEKAMVQLLGNHEYALRLFPLISGLTALILGALLAKRLLSPLGAVVAIALLASSESLIYYSSEVKQYSTDVAIALLLTLVLLSIRQSDLSRNQQVWSGLVGAIAVWFSYPAVFVLAGLEASYLIPRLWTQWQTRNQTPAEHHVLQDIRQRLPIYAAWLLSFGFFYVISVRQASNNDTLESSWDGRFPDNLWDLDWLIGSLKHFFVNPLGFSSVGVGVAIACFLLGCYALNRAERHWFWLLLSPIIVSILVAYARLYPFYERLSLYLVPFFLVLIAASVQLWNLNGRSSRLSRLCGIALTVALLIQPVWTALPLLVQPSYREAMHPLMSYLQTHYKPGDLIYVSEKSEYQFLYYADRYGIKPDDYHIGANNLDSQGDLDQVSEQERDRTLADLETLRGNPRVWVVLSDVELRDEMKVVRSHLNDTARKLDQFQSPNSTSFLYLYDLR